jgi:vacuolar-type H+-ATPase subunit I/STV1
METTFNKKPALSLSTKKREIIFDVITFIFIMLFVYTASSKFMTHESFMKVLGRSPLLGPFHVLLSYLIPAVEIILSGLLLLNKTKRLGLILSLALMLVFTVYLIYMINSGATLPCMCGGVVSLLSWKQHIFFNLGFIVLAIAGLRLHK